MPLKHNFFNYKIKKPSQNAGAFFWLNQKSLKYSAASVIVVITALAL